MDLLLADAGPGIAALESTFRGHGWQVQRASPEGELLRLRHPELGIADLLIAGTEYQQEAPAAARPLDDGIQGVASARAITALSLAWRAGRHLAERGRR